MVLFRTVSLITPQPPAHSHQSPRPPRAPPRTFRPTARRRERPMSIRASPVTVHQRACQAGSWEHAALPLSLV